MPLPRNRKSEYARRKELCQLHHLCLKCKSPLGNNQSVCDDCAQKRRNQFKATRILRLSDGQCACGKELENGKKACSHCLEKIRKSTKKARVGFLKDGKCYTCGGPVINGVSCNKCRERAIRSTLKRYYHNILTKRCAFCGGTLSEHTFRCETCNKAHTTRSYLQWHRRRQLVLAHYGGRCACCGTTQLEFLEVDHINGGGAQHRSINGKSHFYSWIIKNNYPYYLQLLCANCNRGKSKFNICPHQSIPIIPTNRKTRKSRRRRLLAIAHYGGKCTCCGESNWAFLEFDHVNNDGKQHRQILRSTNQSLLKWIRHNNYPNTIQLLCSNCNRAKGLYGRCPHAN